MSSPLCFELSDSMSGSVTNDMERGETHEVTRRYLIGQCDGFTDVVHQVGRYAPSYVLADAAGIFWVRQNLRVQGIGNRYFDCTATYSTLLPKLGDNDPPDEPQPGSIAWDTTGNTERIYQAIQETAYPAGAPLYDGAINVSGNGVEGLDVPKPGMRYSETWILPASLALSYAFVKAVYTLTGTVNASQFRAFSAGEALFMGARCQWQGDKPFAPVTFDFEARPNKDVYFTGGLTVPKKGWEYIWIKYQDEVSANTLVKRPQYVYKDKVFEEKSWFAEGLVIADPSKTVGRPPGPTSGIPPQQAVAAFLARS